CGRARGVVLLVRRAVQAVRGAGARRAAQDRVAQSPGDRHDDPGRVRFRGDRRPVFLGTGLGAGPGHEISDGARGLNVALRWYVVHAYSNFEHRVAQSLKERIARAGLETRFGEILVPTEEVVEMRDGQKRKSERKFYPGYVLVQMEMDEETWHLVRDVPKVLGFIGGT